MRRAAANAAATADALLAWLDSQTRPGAAAASSESNGRPEEAFSAHDSTSCDGVADALTHDVPATAPAAGASTIATRPTERTEAECRATSGRYHTQDSLQHQIDCDVENYLAQNFEDWLAQPSSVAPLSLANCPVILGSISKAAPQRPPLIAKNSTPLNVQNDSVFPTL